MNKFRMFAPYRMNYCQNIDKLAYDKKDIDSLLSKLDAYYQFDKNVFNDIVDNIIKKKNKVS